MTWSTCHTASRAERPHNCSHRRKPVGQAQIRTDTALHFASALILAAGVAAAPLTGDAAEPSERGPSAAEPAGDGNPAVEATPGLTPEQESALKAAVQRGDPVTVESIVVAAIARNPGAATRIIKDAVRAAPSHADLIVDAVQSAFPNLRDRAAAAAREQLDQASPETTIKRGESEGAAPQKKSDQHWSGKLSLGGTRRSGVTRSLSATFGAEVTQKLGRWRNSIDLEFDYDKSKGETNTHRFQMQGRSERQLTGAMYAFGLLSYKNDRFSGFDYQLTESIGAGYRVVDAERFTWDLEAGPSWRQSKITQTGEIANEVFLRGGSQLKWTISDTAEVTNETSVLYNGDTVEIESETGAGFQDSDEVKNVTALDMTVIGNLAARISTEVNYTSDPPPGGTKTETLSKITLVHNF